MKNINQNITRGLKIALWVCLYLILLTPLLVHPAFIFPYITLKTVYFRILVEFSLCLYLILISCSPAYRPPRMNKLILALLAFGIFILLTSLGGLNPYRSFWSTIERGEGFLTISHLIAYCFVLSAVFKKRAQWYWYLSAAVFVSLLNILYAWLQKIGLDWIIVNSSGERVSGTLGNAAYMGAYMLGSFWTSLILLIKRRHLAWKLSFAAAAVLQLIFLFNTQTRGAILAFFVTLSAFLIILIFNARSKTIRKGALLALLLGAAALALLFAYKDRSPIKHSPVLTRITSITSDNITVESRFYAWRASLQAWQDRFLLGYGWENYNIAYNKYFPPQVYMDNGSQIWFDRAHNTLFDVAVASGLIGLVPFLFLYGSALFMLLNQWRRNKNDYLPLLVALLLSGHFIQNFFVFDSISTYIMLYSLFALTVFVCSPSAPPEKDASSPLKFKYLIILPAIVSLAAAVYFFNLRPARANSLGLQALKQLYQGQTALAIETFDRAINMNTYQSPELRQKLVENLLRPIIQHELADNEAAAIINHALALIKTNIKQAPLDTQNYIYATSLLNAAASYDRSYALQVAGLAHQALELSPSRAQIYFELGRAAFNLGQPDNGLAYFKKGVALNPRTLDAHWNLLAAYIVADKPAEAETEYQAMLDIGLEENCANLEHLANIYLAAKKYDKLISIYQKLVRLDPRNEDYKKLLEQLLKIQTSAAQ